MCNDKISHRCKVVFASCTKYEGTIPDFSDLAPEDCHSIQEIAEDLYSIAGEIKEEIDLTSVSAECFPEETDKTVKNFIQVIMDKICVLEDRIVELETLTETQQQEIEDLQNNNCPE